MTPTLPCEFPGKAFKNMEEIWIFKYRVYTLFTTGTSKVIEAKKSSVIVQLESIALCCGKLKNENKGREKMVE